MSMIGQYGSGSVFDAPLDQRLTFLRKTYLHVTGAMFALVALSALLYFSGVSEAMMKWITESGRMGWLAIIGAVMALGWVSSAMTRSETSIGAQYGGLTLYVVLEAVILAPLLWLAAKFAPMALPSATVVTLLTFGGLSAYVFLTNKDFTWMGPALAILMLVAVGTIVCGVIFGFELGIWFSAIMVLLSAGAILYSTSKVLHVYRTDQHVAAALEIFAAVAMMFYWVLRLFLQMRR